MNVRTDTFIVSRHGWDLIFPLGIFTLLLLISIGFELLSLISLFILFLLVYVYRNPERIANYAQEGAILACMDGRVRAINSIDQSPIDGKPGFEIVIERSHLDVAILRAPITSSMLVEKLQRGAMLSLHSSHKNLNENATLRFSSKVGDILIGHRLGSWTRPLSFSTEGEILQNQRYGVMIDGMASIYLPANSRVAIKEGMFLKAGESVIGFFSETA